MRPFRRRLIVAIVCALAVVVLVGALASGLSKAGRNTSSTAQAEAADRLEPYRGLGTWVDLWDAKAWSDPTAAVKDMASHGVRTIYIQTGNARSAGGISNPSAMDEFITEAHARDMYVVAWYLPTLKSSSVDFERVMQAVEFRTDDGQRFDSFALDIESTAVKPLAKRNRALADLSDRIREAVGPDYVLGGIIPSPVGLMKQTGFWNVFPYADVAETYDVLLPMAYYTFHGHTAEQARDDAIESMRILREQPGCSEIPVHLIGGIAGKSSSAEVRAFAKAARETGSIGVSLYDWAGMSTARWRAISAGWNAGAKR